MKILPESSKSTSNHQRTAQTLTTGISQNTLIVGESTMDDDARQLRKYTVYSFFVLTIIVGTSIWFGRHLSESDAKLVVAIILSGACGGILFAVRHSILTWPKLEGNSIHLGWLADCAYGVAGAFSVFLLVPGLSESANEGFTILFPSTMVPPTPSGSDGMELIEIIAVALVGGFAGRSVMQQAQQNVLSSKTKSDTKRLSSNESIGDEDTRAISIAYRTLSKDIESPSAAEINQSIASSSLSVKRVIFDFLEQSIDPVSEDYDEGLIHILTALENSDFGQQSHEVSAFRAKLLAQKERWHEASVSMTRALAIITVADTGDERREDYRTFLEHCEQNLQIANNESQSVDASQEQEAVR